MIIGITGAIGSGKSTVADILKNHYARETIKKAAKRGRWQMKETSPNKFTLARQ